jgi:RHS repeat-associated protein
VVWLTGRLTPDHKTIGDFRKDSGSAIEQICALLRFPGQYFLMEDGLHYNWYRHYDPTIGRYIQPDPLRDVTATSATTSVSFGMLPPLPTSIAAVDSQGGKAAWLPIPAVGSIAAELPEFNGGPSIFGYARQNPMSSTDRNGLQASAACALGPNPACGVGIAMDVAKICIAAAAGILAMSPRTRTGTCSCQHRDIFSSGGISCQTLRETGICSGPYRGTGGNTASCQSDARANAPAACRGCLGHCIFTPSN